ncbi:MAG: DUF342 domain-containing protein [Synergistaceae bacterium]|nr:DUF342 domain-containing protein [Synergistaceae bacterium]MBR0043418.1 DUF342 domain-containing protein [Synergistaceae bacterium]MBR0221159.1 DUF342 domain-containing protein [Synergistaceae bacterium]
MADLNNLIKLEADQDGVWLCSALPESELTPEKFNEINQNDIYELLKSHGVKKYELRAIELFIRSKTGQRVKVANRDAKLEQDAKISVSIAKDAMSASVVIEPPFFTKPWPSEANILAALKNKNIIFGIDKEAIKNLIANKIIEQHVVVAKGKEPIPGKDAYIELIKDPDNPFEIRDDERIDYWSRSTVLTVHPGTQVAVKHPLETGRDGLTVIGTAVKAPAVKNVEFAFGEGLARAADNPFSLVATADGQLKNQNKKLVVLPELEVNKDVDFGIGSIDFTGAVRIKGSVREGFHVIAQGNIDIHGMVEGADIDSQASVIIHGGVRGMGKGIIKASEDVNIGFADQAVIRSGGNILAKNAIMHSKLYARKTVIVLGQGKKSQIVGGRVEAGTEVSCSILGSEMGTKTEVVVGLPPELLERDRVIKREIKRCEENLEKIDPNLVLLKKLETEGQLDDQKRLMMVNLTKMKFQIQAALESMKIEAADLEFQLGSVKDVGIVRVKDTCYPGVVITIKGYTYQVHTECKYTAFVVDEEAKGIKLRTFDAKAV